MELEPLLPVHLALVSFTPHGSAVDGSKIDRIKAPRLGKTELGAFKNASQSLAPFLQFLGWLAGEGLEGSQGKVFKGCLLVPPA